MWTKTVYAAAKEVGTFIPRKAGEFMNTAGREIESTQIVRLIQNKPAKISVCRCWKSEKFPICDNIHQKLQKQGVNVGPAMLEVRPASLKNVGSTLHASGDNSTRNLALYMGVGTTTGLLHLGGFI